MSDVRGRIQVDMQAFLARGEAARCCGIAANDRANTYHVRTRKELLAQRKRIDVYALGDVIARRPGGGQ